MSDTTTLPHTHLENQQTQTHQTENQLKSIPNLPEIVIAKKPELPQIVVKSTGKQRKPRAPKPLLNNDNLYILTVKNLDDKTGETTETKTVFQASSSVSLCNYLLRQCIDAVEEGNLQNEYSRLVLSLLEEDEDPKRLKADDLRSLIDESPNVFIERFEVAEVIRL